ncbi:hypothetical protein GBA52_022500 [Prunus armeniaca]|nr:hypothetical protein GBA52_022500 [Prunus armeniaca]
MNFPMVINFKNSDEVLGIFVPIFIYWIYAGIVAVIETAFPKYKMQTTEEQDEKNLVSRSTVIKGVLVQQSLQAIIVALLFLFAGGANPHDVHAAAHAAAGGGTGAAASACRYIIQFATAMVVMDTWQYFMHRYMHQNKFLYKHIHSHHHRLVAPYAFGALYNHPLEGLMVDTMSGAISCLVSGMSTRASIFFFSFATIKAVDDHSGLWIPWNPFHVFFRNNSGYHALHHQPHGTKYNFSQPFFVFWDIILATYYMPQVDHKNEDKQK